MDNILQMVMRVEMISMLDDFSGYNQVLVREEDQIKTIVTTPRGTYKYL
jgi:hypothetical protein